MSEEFIDWLNQRMTKEGWSQNELARQAGLSSQMVSNVMTRAQGPGPKFLAGVARAFGMLEMDVWELAGKAPKTGPLLPAVRDFNRRLLALDEQSRQVTIRAMDQQLRAVEEVLGLTETRG